MIVGFAVMAELLAGGLIKRPKELARERRIGDCSMGYIGRVQFATVGSHDV